MISAHFGNLGNVNAHSLYMESFYGVPEGTVLNDPFGVRMGSDYDARAEFKSLFAQTVEKKAGLDTTSWGTGTAGQALVPVYVDQTVIDLSRKYTPLVEIIPRVTNLGLTADYNEITAKGAAVTAAEGASLTAVTDTGQRVSKPIKYLYAKGSVTGQAQAAVPPYNIQGFNAELGQNAKQQQVILRARALKELEEATTVNGDSSTTATEFDGIVKQMGTTNTLDKSSSAIALADFYTAAQYAFDDGGRPSIAVVSSSVFTDIAELLTEKFRYMPQDSKLVEWGASSLKVDTIVGPMTVIPSMNLSNTSGSKSVYMVDLSTTEMRVLQDLTYKDLPDEDDKQVFLLKIYEALALKAPTFGASITNIA